MAACRAPLITVPALNPMTPSDEGASAPVHQDRLWVDNGWTARVVKNEDDEAGRWRW